MAGESIEQLMKMYLYTNTLNLNSDWSIFIILLLRDFNFVRFEQFRRSKET